MSLFNKISPRFLGKIAWTLVNLIGKTLSIDIRGMDQVAKMKDKSAIFVLWHGRLFIPMFCLKNNGIFVLVSEHRDGEIITSSIEAAGNDTVRGSTTRGGARALVKLVKLVKNGAHAAITPDGPKGPRWKFQAGAVYVAAKTGTPIIPLGGSARNSYYFKSWDSFQFPKPFSKSVFKVGEPYYVTGALDNENIEFHRAAIEQILIDLTLECDKISGAVVGK
ncbi:lysophospholipid acyltransferase family protein [Candidatus Latescibacterota bacterium]